MKSSVTLKGYMMFKFLCRHNRVKVVRWHPDVISKSMKNKVLYTDEKGVGVLNFVQCDKCGKFLDTNQKQRLYAEKVNET